MSVLAVPRSIARSRENNVCSQSNIGGFSGAACAGEDFYSDPCQRVPSYKVCAKPKREGNQGLGPFALGQEVRRDVGVREQARKGALKSRFAALPRGRSPPNTVTWISKEKMSSGRGKVHSAAHEPRRTGKPRRKRARSGRPHRRRLADAGAGG